MQALEILLFFDGSTIQIEFLAISESSLHNDQPDIPPQRKIKSSHKMKKTHPSRPLHRPILPPHHIIKLTYAALRIDAATQRHRRDLQERLELWRQSAVGRMEAMQQDMSEEGDGSKTEGANSESTVGDGGDDGGRSDVRAGGWRRHGMGL